MAKKKKLELSDKQKTKLDIVPKSYKRITEKAIRGKASATDAIKANCLECVGYVREEVKVCCSTTCPLHAYRPYTTK